ncbi:glycosyltransferase [Microvirga rosea]|uniref:glycosyltransferase n=1 Tax=Microvirga rosea TaxID=2715425 RepID=UPI001D0B683A|nr:glycosyltransferase [Microvirga rosea]MCB8820167.1 glycosyltransferase [Microvirga rosea]
MIDHEPSAVSTRTPVKRGRSIGIIAISAIADDPRVRRQGDAFANAGWDITGIGLADARSVAPAWPILTNAEPDVPAGTVGTAWQGAGQPPGSWIMRQGQRRMRQVLYVVGSQLPRIWPAYAEKHFGRLRKDLARLYTLGSGMKPDIWLANDWTALPIAGRLAREQGGILVYDTHELAADEYAQRLRWQLLNRPVTVALESRGVRQAALVTCVSDGIADRLQEIYDLKTRPQVIRNTPSYQEMPFRPTRERIRVLYHGIVAPGRGLEECILSVPSWRKEFSLTIRGPAHDGYRATLEALIARAGVRDRVDLAPAVPMVDLVREANPFDVGLFALPDHSRHNRFALPNKFFEYTMAGLALCVSDLPEMSRLVKEYDLGLLFKGMEPSVISAAINSLDPATIDRYKQRSLAAARRLNWEKESEKLVSLCSQLLDAKGKS